MNKTLFLSLSVACLSALVGATLLWQSESKNGAQPEAAEPKPQVVPIDSAASAPVVWPSAVPEVVSLPEPSVQPYLTVEVAPEAPVRQEIVTSVEPEARFSAPIPESRIWRSTMGTEVTEATVELELTPEPQAAEPAELFPGGWEKSAKEFNAFLTGTYLPEKIRQWQNTRGTPRDVLTRHPVMLSSTKTDRSGTHRSYLMVESFTKEGEFQVRSATYPPGYGWVFGRVEKLDFSKADLDSYSLETLFGYHAETRNDEDGNKVLASFAAWLYANGAEWGGNRALALLARRRPQMLPIIQDFVRERHKFEADADIRPTLLPGFLGWEELIPESLEEDRKKAREADCKAEMEILRWRIEQSFESGSRATLDALARDFVAPRRGPTPIGLSVSQMEVEIQAIEQFCRGSQEWAKDAEAYEAVKEDRRRERDRRATLQHWLLQARERIKPVEEIGKSARDIMADADSKRRAGTTLRAEGKGEDQLREAYKRYNDAAEELRKLLPTRTSPRGGPLDAYNGHHWIQLAEALRYACEPDRNLERCNDESKAREAIVAATIGLRYFPNSHNTILTRAICLMLTKNFKDARADFESIIDDEKAPGGTRNIAKQYIEQIERIESREIRERALKGMGKN